MKIPTPTAEELRALCQKLSREDLTKDDWIIIAACVTSIAMLQMLMEEGATIGPFIATDDGRPNSVIEAILTMTLEVKKNA